MSKFRFIFILLLIHTISVFAQTSSKRFCQELVSSNQNTAHVDKNEPNRKLELSFLFNAIFTPQKIVEIKGLPQSPLTNRYSESSSTELKYVFILTPQEFLTKKERKALKDLKRNLKVEFNNLKDSILFKELSNTTDINHCLKYFNEHEEKMKKILSLDSKIKTLKKLQAKDQNLQTYKLIRSKTKFLLKDGWKIIEGATYYRANELLNNNATRAIFIAHSAKDGRILDAKNNTIPSNFFKSMPNSLAQIIMYSCNSLKVIKHYDIKSTRDNYEYFYPLTVKRYKSFLGDTTPILSLKKIKALSLKSYSDKIQHSKKCQFSIESQHTNPGYSLYLNNNYIGSLSNTRNVNSFEFDCSLLTSKNSIKVFRTKDSRLVSTNDRFISIKINTIDKHEVRFFKNHYSKINSNHIVSLINFNYKTTHKEKL